MSEEKKDKPNLEQKFKQAFKYLGPQFVAQIAGGNVAAERTQNIIDKMRAEEASEVQRIEQRKLDQAKEQRAIDKEKRKREA